MITPEMVEAAAKAIRDEGGAPGHSLHSWRCEDPGRYGECDCVKETAKVILEAVEPLIRQQTAEAIADAIHLKRDQRSYHETVGEWSEVSHGGVLLGLKEGEQIAREYGKGDPT